MVARKQIIDGVKMKNIVIVDSGLNIYNRVKLWEDIKIKMLIVENDKQKNEVMQEGRVDAVYSFEDINKYKDKFVSAEEIERFRYIQLKVERFNARFNKLCSYNIASYYNSLAFWLNVFSQKIDCVFCDRNEHGAGVDSLLFEIAKVNCVPVFGPVSVFKNSALQVFAIRCYNTGKHVNLQQIGKEISLNENSLKEALYYKTSDSEKEETRKKEKSFKKYWHKKFLNEMITGNIMREYRGGILFQLSPKEILHSYKCMKDLKKFYKKVSVTQVERKKPAVFYALHYEPEASFMNKVFYDSQLYNIQMLASALPEGWILYVKEHPHQVRLFNRTKFMSLKCIENYRDKEFYRQILENSNVRLLGWDMNSNQIMEMEEIRAVSSINGTVALECIEKQKPVILFDAESVVYGEQSNIFKIHSFEELHEAIEDIDKNRQPISYVGTLERIAQYVYVKQLKGNPWEIPEEILRELLYRGENYLQKNVGET